MNEEKQIGEAPGDRNEVVGNPTGPASGDAESVRPREIAQSDRRESIQSEFGVMPEPVERNRDVPRQDPRRKMKFDIPPFDRDPHHKSQAAENPDGPENKKKEDRYKTQEERSKSFVKHIGEARSEVSPGSQGLSDRGWGANAAGNAPSPSWPESAFQNAEGDLYKTGFLIALAAQHGCPDNIVKSAARGLEARFRKRLSVNLEIQKHAGPLKLDLPLPQSKLMNQFEAESFRTSGEDAPAERLRFLGPDHARAVICYAWYELGASVGEDLTPWLLELGCAPSLEARRAAGAAAGLLAQRDFSGIRSLILDQWFRDVSPKALDALDAALTVLASTPLAREAVTNLVKGWFDGEHINEIWAVGVLTRGLWGRDHPDLAMSGFAALLKKADPSAYEQAVLTFVSWFERGSKDPASGARAMEGLQQILSEEPKHGQNEDWEIELKADLIFISMIGASAEDDEEILNSLRGALSTEASKRAAARMLHVALRPRHVQLIQHELDLSAKAALEALILAAMKRNRALDPAWFLIDAGLRFADTKERERFAGWLENRRKTGVRRDLPGLSRFDSVINAAVAS